MSWDKRRQVLNCDHRTPKGVGEGRQRAQDIEMVPCQEVTLATTAIVARSKARAKGWETNTPNGDRCGTHRVTRPRAGAR